MATHLTEQQDPTTTDFLRWSNWLPLPVVLVQRDGRWRAVNRHWQVLSGLALDASVGAGWQQTLHPDSKAAQLEHWNACCHANTTAFIDMQFGEAATGRYVWYQVMLQPLDSPDETGLLVATLTPIRDGKIREADLQARIAVNEERIDALELANGHLLEESALYHQAQQQLQTAAVRLNHIIAIQSELASASLNLDAFLQLVVDRVRDVSPANIAIIEMLEGDELVYGAASGLEEDFKRIRLKTDSSLAGLCVQTRTTQTCTDATTDPRVDQAVCAAVGVQSLLAVPIIRAGEAIGVLMLMAKKKRAFRQADTQTAQMLAGLTASAIGHQLSFEANQQLIAQLQQMAHHDSLTGLPNRLYFYELADRAFARYRRSRKMLAVLFLDVDRFKQVNDTFGHEMGDALLQQFTQRLQRLVRETDTVARLGGDEFVILLEDLPAPDVATAIAAKIVAAMQESFVIEGQALRVGTSIGVAVLNSPESTPDQLVSQADSAMYEAKTAGRNTYRMYEP